MGRKKLTPGGEVRKGACKECGGDIVRLMRPNGKWEDNKKFKTKKYCSPKCRVAARSNRPPPPIALRNCPHCGDVISILDKHGNRLKPSLYKKLSSCGAPACRKATRVKGGRPKKTKIQTQVFNPPQNQPIDWFIYGRAI